MDANLLDTTAAAALLRSHGVQGTDAELSKLINICDGNSSILERIAVILANLADSQASRIDEPDVIEAVIQELLHSDCDRALQFYQNYYAKGGYGYNVQRSDYRFGLRIVSALQQIDSSSRSESYIINNPEIGFPAIEHDRALFLTELGELKQAETILRELAFSQKKYYYSDGQCKVLYQYAARQNLCDVLVLQGRLREAEQIADGTIQAYESDLTIGSSQTRSESLLSRITIGERCFMRHRLYSGCNPYARRAVALYLQGKIRQALADFKQAEAFSLRKTPSDYLELKVMMRLEKLEQPIPDWDEMEIPHRTLIGQAAIFYALLLTRLGKLDTALKVLNYSKRCAEHPSNNLPSMLVCAEVALSDVYRLKGEYELAQQNLEHPLAWAAQTGQQEISCWAHLSLARLKHAQNQLAIAQNTVDEACTIATRHGFILYEIDCLVTAGRIALSQQDLITAEQKAKAALLSIGDPDMAYAWGHGNTLHLMGEILCKKNNLENAHEFLTGAAKLRERIEDPRLLNTKELLSQISPQIQGN